MVSIPQEIQKILDKYKKPINAQLIKEITPHKLSSLSSLQNQKIENIFWSQVQDYPERGGKYIRSILICLTCDALGGDWQQVSIPTAVAMEISQNWILIHDDIQDESEMRRGDKALHLKIGIDHAINAGDALHIIMWKVLESNIEVLKDDKKSHRIFQEFYKMLMRTTVGQTAEMSSREKFDLTEEDVFYILDGKTGYYTIGGPCRLGALTAGFILEKDPELFENINDFGLNLGRAFQIIDDILDVTSDFEQLKVKGNDIQEGKRSLLIVKLLNKISGKDKTDFITIMKKKMGTRTPEEIDQVISWMHSYKIIEEARQQAYGFANDAREALTRLPFKESHTAYFSALINFMVERTY